MYRLINNVLGLFNRWMCPYCRRVHHAQSCGWCNLVEHANAHSETATAAIVEAYKSGVLCEDAAWCELSYIVYGGYDIEEKPDTFTRALLVDEGSALYVNDMQEAGLIEYSQAVEMWRGIIAK